MSGRDTATRIHRVEQHRSQIGGIEAMTLTSNHQFPRHSHDQFGIGVIAFGMQRSWSQCGMVEAAAGDVIMVNPGEIHDGIAVGGARGWRMLYLDPGLLAAQTQNETHGAAEMQRPVVSDPHLARLFASLFACATDPHSDRLARDERLLRAVMFALRKHGTAIRRTTRSAPVVTPAIERLACDPAASVSLAELAELCGVSRFALLRGFVREIGITPHAYQIARRVSLARTLLAQGFAPACAAEEAGFADQSHLTRAFVRQLGVTPSRYRAAVIGSAAIPFKTRARRRDS